MRHYKETPARLLIIALALGILNSTVKFFRGFAKRLFFLSVTVPIQYQMFAKFSNSLRQKVQRLANTLRPMAAGNGQSFERYFDKLLVTLWAD
jgi:hypothetical protein